MLANPQQEQMSAEELRALQLARLQRTVAWAYEKSGFYKRKFDAAGVGPEDIRSLDDVTRLPFTTMRELEQGSSLDLLTLPFSALSRISMWEQPKPVLQMYTARDIACNVEMLARAMAAAGIHRGSIVGVLGDLADSGLADMQSALQLLGATVVPLSTDYERAIQLLEATRFDLMVGTGRLILRFVIQMQAVGKEITDYHLSKIFCLNENLQNPLRTHMKNRTGAQIYTYFASPILGSAGIFYQCDEHVGQHIQEDYYYPEVAAYGREEILSDTNCMGELVLTTLMAEAMPIIRFRTGQTVMRVDGDCACGRTFMRVTTPYGSV